MSEIREKASDVLGKYIDAGQWDTLFREADKEGKLTQRHVIDFLLVIFKYLEEKEA